MFFWNSFFYHDPADVGKLISGSSAFSKSSLKIWKFMVDVLLKPGLESFEHYFLLLYYCNWCHRENMFSWCLEGTFWTLTNFRRTVDGSGMKSLMEMKIWRTLYQRKLLAESISCSLKFKLRQPLHSDSLWGCLMEDELSLFIRADNLWTLNQLQILNMTTVLLLRGWHHKAKNFMTVNSGPFVLF